MSKVYVVQNLLTKNRQGELVSKFDLTPAKEHGPLVFILGDSASPFNPESLLPEIHAYLSEYRTGDKILLIGNPILIGMVAAIAADYNEGNVTFLQWSGKKKRYIEVHISNLFDDGMTA